MKIKNVFLSCLMLCGALTASAQEAKTEYVHNPYWYIQLQGGAQYTLGEINFKDLISPNVQVTVGRQFTPVFGARLAVNAWQSRAGVDYNEIATYVQGATGTGTVTAGTPYLIMPASDVNLDEKTFSDVTFNSSDEGSTTATEGYAYVGLLQPKTFSTDKTHLFVGKNNTFVRLSGSATLTGARAYFTIPEAAYSKKFNLGSFDDITGISNVIIQTDADNSKIYNLNGQMVGTNWNTLPQGVYIVNGKKIVK